MHNFVYFAPWKIERHQYLHRESLSLKLNRLSYRGQKDFEVDLYRTAFKICFLIFVITMNSIFWDNWQSDWLLSFYASKSISVNEGGLLDHHLRIGANDHTLSSLLKNFVHKTLLARFPKKKGDKKWCTSQCNIKV